MILTAKIKIKITPELIRTNKLYTKCLQYCINIAWRKKIKNSFKLHHLVYKHLRKYLPSQLAISCIKQASGIVKKAKSKPIINKSSVRYNFYRSAKYKNNILSLLTIKGRQRFEINIPNCFKEYFQNWQMKEGLLRIDNKQRCFFLFSFKKNNIVNNLENKTLGIDLGINNIAATSENKLFKANKIKQIKRKFKYLRAKLQAKGTKSAKRLLKKISGREQRFMAWINHNISKNIVNNFNGNKIVMENLKGVRKKKKGKKLNYLISNWSFFQLQNFISYKAEMKGIKVEKVSPYYSSQICSKCGELGKRNRGYFECNCGFKLNADLNASRNLARGISYLRQDAVNHPNISSLVELITKA